MIGRNNSGLATFTVAKQFEGTFSAKISEAMAILCAVEEAISRGLHHVELESDCQRVINMLSSSVAAANELGKIVRKIKDKCFSYNFVFRYVPRAANRVAYNLAHYALSISLQENWDSLFPDWINSFIINDIS